MEAKRLSCCFDLLVGTCEVRRQFSPQSDCSLVPRGFLLLVSVTLPRYPGKNQNEVTVLAFGYALLMEKPSSRWDNYARWMELRHSVIHMHGHLSDPL